MIKRILVIVTCCFSMSGFACPNALPTDNVNFCASFKTAAICHCTSSGLPAGMCQNMTALYNRMIAVFGSLQRTCEFQKYTTTQDCIDNWNCYLRGGQDSNGKLCSSTQQAC